MEAGYTCDVALAGDLENSMYLESYVEAHRSWGLDTTIISSAPPGGSQNVGHDGDGRVRHIDPEAASAGQVKARLLVLIWPWEGVPVAATARRVLVVVPGGGETLTAESVAQCETMLLRAGARATWAPQTNRGRARLRELFGAEIDISPENWQPVADPGDWPDPLAGGHEPRPVIGVLARSNESCDPEYRASIQALVENRKIILRCLSDELEAASGWGISHPRAAVFARGEIAPSRFMNSISFFNALPADEHRSMYLPFISLALARGAVVFLRPVMASEFGDAVVAAEPNEVSGLLNAFVADQPRYLSQVRRAREYAAEQYGRKAYQTRLLPLLGDRRFGAPNAPRIGRNRIDGNVPPAILFVSSNGVGIGHLVRLMAIARRCPKNVSPVFVTMAQAVDRVVAEGWPCEYLNSPGRVAGPYRSWNAYFRQELEGIVEFHRPKLIVYDGNSLPQGLMDLVGDRPGIGLVWVRRAMWGNWSEARALQDITAQKSCDLVIEPRELAEERDSGATATSFDKVPEPLDFARVPPITYLDAGEALSREEARREIGITEPRAVLIAFGAGALTDQYETVERIIRALKPLNGLQVIVARHIISDNRGSLPHGADTRHLFPMSRFFAAFDGVISAAGYNTFHEVVRADVPTLLIPVEAAQMDRQLDRAQWAESRGLARVLRQRDLDELPHVLAELLNGKPRRGAWVPRAELPPASNGAARAAALVSDLALRYARWPTEFTDSAARHDAMIAAEG